MGDIRNRWQMFQGVGATVVAITFCPVEDAIKLSQELSLPFPLVCDTQKVLYQTFGLGRASYLGFFSPKVLFKFFVKVLSGWLPSLRYSREDLLQLGGDFILGVNGEIKYAYRSDSPVDRPTAENLVAELKKVKLG